MRLSKKNIYYLIFIFGLITNVSCKKQKQQLIPKIYPFEAQIDVYVGEALEISGENLNVDTKGLAVKFGDIEAKLISVNQNKIIVEVPWLSEREISTINVNLQKQWLTIGTCKLGLIAITQKPITLKYDDTLTVYGRNLHLVPYNTFTLKGHLAFPDELTPQYVKRVLTYFPAKHRKTSYDFRYKDIDYTYSDITISNKWYWATKLLFVPNNPENVFTLNSEIYILSTEENLSTGPYYLYKFNPENYLWTKTDVPKGAIAATSINGKIFLATENRELLELKNGIVTKISDIPDKFSGKISMKSNNGKLYILMNVEFFNEEMFFYIFNESTRIWEQKSVPVMNFGFGSATFIVNNSFYVFDSKNRMWQYNENANNWTEKAKCAFNAKNWRTGFVYHNKIYCALGDLNDNKEQLFVYDPTTDLWYDQGPTTNRKRGSTMGFTVNDQFYFGGSINETINKHQSDLIQTEAFDITGFNPNSK